MNLGLCLNLICGGLVAPCLPASTAGAGETQTYKPTWESLSQKAIPEWMEDAKFGLYTHFGVFSVPAHGGPDYIKNLYGGPEKDVKGTYSYHVRKYGPLNKFGYKDFVPMFKAEKFNADEWVGLMHEAGARFGGILCVHHDGFLLWDSKVNRWNAMDMGPKRDIYGEIAKAVRKYDDMKLLATFHHGRTFGYATGFMAKEGRKPVRTEATKNWDIWNPDYKDFYWNEAIGASAEVFAAQWQAKIREVVDKYNPDCIWFDGLRGAMRGNHPSEKQVREVLAYYLNEAARKGRDVVVCNKHAGGFNFPESFGLRCYENGRDMAPNVGPWFLIDRAIAYPWSYVNDKKYKDGAGYHVRSLVDVVSRGGIFLLSLTPKGDGSIPPEEQEIMRGIGRWLKVNGEAIYGTRPWTVYAEGPTQPRGTKRRKSGQTAEQWDWRKPFTAEDIRYTRSRDGRMLYAIALGWPKGRFSPTALQVDDATGGKVELIGHAGSLSYSVDGKRIRIDVPAKPPCDYAYAFKLSGFKTSITPEAAAARDEALKTLRSELNGAYRSEGRKGNEGKPRKR